MATVTPYTISIPPSRLTLLHQKLALATFPDELDASEWDYGVPLPEIKRLAAYWRDNFDWRAAEARLNTLPQFTTPISVDGFERLNVHFIHQRSKVKNAIPLLFAHGWPGSFDEVAKMLPGLVDGWKEQEGVPSFHVVAPSLVNFGFSEGTKKRGFKVRHHAQICHKLMLALGYDQYVTQGGDIGHGVIRCMARLYPTSCRATHTNFPRPLPPSPTTNPSLHAESEATPLTPAEKTGEARTKWFTDEGMGYYHIQATKPQTLGYSLSDSPVGLLAWIYEKLHDWSDSYPWTPDEICTWVSIYWFSTAGPTASLRAYYESKHDPEADREKTSEYIPDVFLGTAKFAKELIQARKLWNQGLGPLILNSEYDHGGHFAAWERGDAIVKDLRRMFGKEGGAQGAVEGKRGWD